MVVTWGPPGSAGTYREKGANPRSGPCRRAVSESLSPRLLLPEPSAVHASTGFVGIGNTEPGRFMLAVAVHANIGGVLRGKVIIVQYLPAPVQQSV